MWKRVVDGSVTATLGKLARSSNTPTLVSELNGADANHFVAAFCGTGTGHFTQTLTVVQLLQAQGMTLAGIITDTTASKKMIDEMLGPLGVRVLILPTIDIMDEKRGMKPSRKILWQTYKLTRALNFQEIREFLVGARAGLLLDFYLLPLARFLQSHKLPESVHLLHIAPQFALVELTSRQLHTLPEVLAWRAASRTRCQTQLLLVISQSASVTVRP